MSILLHCIAYYVLSYSYLCESHFIEYVYSADPRLFHPPFFNENPVPCRVHDVLFFVTVIKL